MSDASELKPCPFCGETDQEVLMVQHMEETVLHPTYRVACYNCGASSGWTDSGNHVAEWNRRDPAVLAELPEVKAMIAAAIKRAAGVTEGWVRRAMHLSPDGYEVERTHGHMAQKAADNIRASIRAGHKAALDRMLQDREQRGRNEALREAVMKARLAMVGNPQADELTCSICADAIRALIKEPKP